MGGLNGGWCVVLRWRSECGIRQRCVRECLQRGKVLTVESLERKSSSSSSRESAWNLVDHNSPRGGEVSGAGPIRQIKLAHTLVPVRLWILESTVPKLMTLIQTTPVMRWCSTRAATLLMKSLLELGSVHDISINFLHATLAPSSRLQPAQSIRLVRFGRVSLFLTALRMSMSTSVAGVSRAENGGQASLCFGYHCRRSYG